MGEKNRWRSVSQEDWEVALARETVIRSLSDQVEVTAKEVAKATAELGISRSLLFRLLAKFRKRPQVSKSVMPCLLLFGATGMGKTRIVQKFKIAP